MQTARTIRRSARKQRAPHQSRRCAPPSQSARCRWREPSLRGRCPPRPPGSAPWSSGRWTARRNEARSERRQHVRAEASAVFAAAERAAVKRRAQGAAQKTVRAQAAQAARTSLLSPLRTAMATFARLMPRAASSSKSTGCAAGTRGAGKGGARGSVSASSAPPSSALAGDSCELFAFRRAPLRAATRPSAAPPRRKRARRQPAEERGRKRRGGRRAAHAGEFNATSLPNCSCTAAPQQRLAAEARGRQRGAPDSAALARRARRRAARRAGIVPEVALTLGADCVAMLGSMMARPAGCGVAAGVRRVGGADGAQQVAAREPWPRGRAIGDCQRPFSRARSEPVAGAGGCGCSCAFSAPRGRRRPEQRRCVARPCCSHRTTHVVASFTTPACRAHMLPPCACG